MLAASAGVFVFALAFSLYALVEPEIGAAGAAATVAGTTAALIAAGAGITFIVGRPKRSDPAPPAGGVVERGLRFMREKPLVAISAAVGAGFLAVRNPKYLGAAIRSFVEGREGPAAKR